MICPTPKKIAHRSQGAARKHLEVLGQSQPLGQDWNVYRCQCGAWHISFGGPINPNIPIRSPYRHGDRVQMHGYGGEMAGHRRTGFRGIVTGFLGATILEGVTDAGDTWAEYWGRIEPDGTPSRSGGAYCTCCPRPAHGPVQLELFAVSA